MRPPSPRHAASPDVSVIHAQVPGRARFHVGGLRGRPSVAQLLEKQLARIDEIRSVRADAWTGNVLVTFPPERALDTVRQLVKKIVDTVVAALARGEKELPPPSDGGPDWHTLGTAEAVARLGSSVKTGLTGAIACQRLREVGRNQLQSRSARSSLSILAGQFKSLPVAVLVGSAGVSLVTGGTADAVMILSVVLANAYVGFATEAFAERTLSSLTRLGPREARVIRDGKPVTIKAEAVVPGDLLLLTPGAYVSADARLLHVDELSVDESLLTGESVPVKKRVKRLATKAVPLAERLNLVFRGTVVTGGKGIAVVVGTGRHTEIGHIQRLVDQTERATTPLQAQLDRLSVQLVGITSATSAIVLAAGLWRGFPLGRTLKIAVSLAIAAVPEGLPTVAMTTLAQSVQRMRRRKVMIRRLGAVETLGGVQVICLDKTGTLTLNQMTAVQVFVGRQLFDVRNGAFFGPSGEAVRPRRLRGLRRLSQIVALCSEVRVTGGEENGLEGSPTEKALIELARSAGYGVAKVRARFPLQSTDYRSETRAYMMTTHRTPKNQRFIAVKGNPEEVLALCQYYLDGEKRRPLTATARAAIRHDGEQLADEALRVLGMAYAYDKDPNERREPVLTWVGQVGITDPLRPEMPAMVRAFHDAGIHTTLVTGDQSATATAIGRALGLGNGRRLRVIDAGNGGGASLGKSGALKEVPDIYSRVSPAEKLLVVESLQRLGQIVAMAGDGVNDAPALKAADIGIAMGRRGTEVAREIADIVLLDDNLSDLISAIELGRTTNDNIRKAVHYLLSTNLSEMLLVTGGMLVGLGEVLSPLQLLWINLVTDVFPALALALDPPEEGILRRPPTAPGPLVTPTEFRRIATESLVMMLTALAAHGFAVRRYGPGPESRTMGFVTLTAAQILHTLSSRAYHVTPDDERPLAPNRYVYWAIGGGALLQFMALGLPPVRRALGATLLRPGDWLVAGAAAGANYFINEGIRIWRQSTPAQKGGNA